MDRPGDIQVLCRLCLVKDQVNIPIFEEQGDIRQIFIKISCCLPVSITKEDNLPKKICDGCSNKLDLLYEFWNTSINAEKTLLTWLGQAGVKDADKTITAVALQIPKAEVEVKVEQPEEIDGGEVEDEEIDGGEVEDFEENDNYEEEEPPPKRARRSAAVKAQMTLANISDDDEDEDIDNDESTTKIEDESDGSEGEVKDPSSFTAIPGTSVDDQPGPSGLGKDGADAPYMTGERDSEEYHIILEGGINIKEKTVNMEEIRNKLESLSQSNIFIKELTDHQYYKENHIKDNDSLNVELDHRKDSELIQCPICQTFMKEILMNRHIQRVHSDHPKLKCDSCDKDFKREYTLNNHISICHSKYTVIFKCEFCDRTFKRKNNLLGHVKRIHSERTELLKCYVCSKSFKLKANLPRHIK